MRTRTFGSSNLETSVIGFGCHPLGRGQYGALDDDEAIAAVHAARDAGVTLYDTAAVYGWGYSEKLLGRALKGWRENVVVVTKGGRRWEPGITDRRVGPRSDSSRQFI
ncbi:aldo/keto reductase, partial [bacterium]|nr:aldo/keto reductase [bacterium]